MLLPPFILEVAVNLIVAVSKGSRAGYQSAPYKTLSSSRKGRFGRDFAFKLLRSCGKMLPA